MSWLKDRVRQYDPKARLLDDGDGHATFPGYFGARALGGAENAGLRNPLQGMSTPAQARQELLSPARNSCGMTLRQHYVAGFMVMENDAVVFCCTRQAYEGTLAEAEKWASDLLM